MSFNIVRKETQGVQIGDDITVRVLKSNLEDNSVLLALEAPYGTRIERCENIEAGYTTSVDQYVRVSTAEEIKSHIEECKYVCDTKERQRLMLRALPELQKLSDEACDALMMMAN